MSRLWRQGPGYWGLRALPVDAVCVGAEWELWGRDSAGHMWLRSHGLHQQSFASLADARDAAFLAWRLDLETLPRLELQRSPDGWTSACGQAVLCRHGNRWQLQVRPWRCQLDSQRSAARFGAWLMYRAKPSAVPAP